MLFLSLLSLAALVRVAQAALAFKGADWSSVPVEEAAGKTYKNTAGTTQPFETILRASGANTVRQRLWVNPADGNYNLAYNIKLAKRAQAAGLAVYLDIHFSDTWADPGQQATPSVWSSYNIDDLANAVYHYTLDVSNTFASNNIPLAIVSIGNEITNGMLWPLGKLSNPGGAYDTARLLHSASAGIKDSSLATKPRIMIHLDNGWNYNTQQTWYDNILSQGPLLSTDYDAQGVSYYPFYNSAATLASIRSSLTSMKQKYGKTIMVVETNWPTYCPNPKYPFPADTTSIPFSPDGQTTWMKDVAAAVTAAGGVGLFYWEPAWIDNAPLGSSCGYNLMVDDTGKAMSSLASFAAI
ncbi:hypothetical protein LTS18_006993, partial [Coniosporium uncinatum]